MNILIIEDERPAANKLEQMLRKYDPTFDVQDKLGSVEEAREWFRGHPQPDLLFLDIHLSDGSCFELIDDLILDCPVIFTTAYDQYALDAFKFNSIDYLLKPIKQEKLEKAIDKMIRFTKQESNGANEVSGTTKLKTYKSRFLVKSGNRIRSIRKSEIAYFYSQDKLIFLITRQNDKYPVNLSLDKLEEVLDPSCFFRVNRQVIVHIDCIENIYSYFKGRLKLELTPLVDFEVIVSGYRSAAFKMWLDQ